MSVGKFVGWAALALLALSRVAAAETITVTISSDVVDIDWSTATIADLPGPDGEVSFSEAMIAANNTPGHQSIGFAIPQSDWTLQFVLPGRAVLRTTTGFFFRASDEVTIDGTTQTAFTGDTNPDGNEVAIYGSELYLNADNCTIIGFDSTAVSLNGSNSTAQGNTGSMNISLYGGSGCLIQNNTGGTIKIDRSNNNIVVGNTVTRVRVLGWVGGGQPAVGNRVGGPNPADRNYITGYGTWDGEGFPGGTTVQIFDSVDTIVENNWIGTTPDGLAQGSLASTAGVGFEGENHGAVIRNNRIAGILGHGIGPHADGLLFGSAIYVNGTGTNITIEGNTIGLDANGAPVLGSVTGLTTTDYFAGPVQGITIDGNEIAGHLLWGITVANPLSGIRISANSIHDNGDIGIDLVPPNFVRGVTLNDSLDLDAGGNGLQNFPEIASASRAGTALRVVGTLHSSPSSEFTLQFFTSPECDPSGYGEGQVFVGAIDVMTDTSGDAGFDVALDALALDGWVVTATATLEPSGATSEFSACVAIAGGLSVGDLNCDGAIDNFDIDPFVLALTSASETPPFGSYDLAYPDCKPLVGDVNGDGVVNNFDIDPFVALLLNN